MVMRVNLTTNVVIPAIVWVHILNWLMTVLNQLKQFYKMLLLLLSFQVDYLLFFKDNQCQSSRIERMYVILTIEERPTFFVYVMK